MELRVSLRVLRLGCWLVLELEPALGPALEPAPEHPQAPSPPHLQGQGALQTPRCPPFPPRTPHTRHARNRHSTSTQPAVTAALTAHPAPRHCTRTTKAAGCLCGRCDTGCRRPSHRRPSPSTRCACLPGFGRSAAARTPANFNCKRTFCVRAGRIAPKSRPLTNAAAGRAPCTARRCPSCPPAPEGTPVG